MEIKCDHNAQTFKNDLSQRIDEVGDKLIMALVKSIISDF